MSETNFSTIPLNLRTPGARIEFDSSKSRQGLPTRNPRILVQGQKVAAGAVAPLVLTRMTSPAGAVAAWGAGSMLAQEVTALLNVNSSADVFAIAQADDAGGVAAVWTVTYAGPSTAAGSAPLMIGGRQVHVAVAAADTAATVATAMAAAITAVADMPVTASVAGAVVTLTSKHKGLAGNGIDIRSLYYDEDAMPAGLTAVIASTVVGATDPLTAAMIAAIGDEAFDLIVTPYQGTANLTALETELTARWAATRMQDGIAITAMKGTHGALLSFGGGRNSQFVTVLGLKAPPALPWEIAGVLAGVVAYYGFIDPARPFQTLQLPGLLPPVAADRFSQPERELLLRDGISTYKVTPGGEMAIDRLITMYQVDSAGNADIAYLSLNTLLMLSYMRWSLVVSIGKNFPRHKLANDSAVTSTLPFTMTPKVGRAFLLAWARDMEGAGILENVDQFKADLRVERDGSNPDQLNALIPPDLVNQFIAFAAKIEFRL